ncbi:oligosaccharide repeat unit polymerase [Mucilaginibacter sp. Bleaf8]|uniref:O-antigen polymerase n=1 Tax=Mucilaginibacter sp. Bleaf8 TaxID=2834430 RepID=UPI001BCFA979|nr:O-antigen polymerase [Mucilaginibacter sp. Bleaf8]MBS7562856.1 oligosaccharide repeat unit polymerase [Mucilaginibacter sp. Bleaf8]
MSYFMTFLLMYPFATAELNVLTIGPFNLAHARESITTAYFITLTGFMCFFIGGLIYRTNNTQTPIYWFLMMPFKKTLGTMYSYIVGSRIVTTLVFALYASLMFFVLMLAFKAGMGNNPRGFFLKNDSLRPVFNLTNSISGIASGLIIARIFVYNQRYDKILLALFIFLTFFIGSRGGAVGPLLSLFTNWLYFKKQGRISFFTLAFVALGILSLVAFLSFFRSGQGGSGAGVLNEILYGNSFSDLRDMSWIISVWDGNYFYGKTYLAAFMSFVPSSLSAFRMEWSIGKVTARMAGYSPAEHPGVRPGTFGEVYLNFGIVGVIVLGILMGYSTRYIDRKVKDAAKSKNVMSALVSGKSGALIGNLAITAGFFGFYISFIIFTVLFLLSLCMRFLKSDTGNTNQLSIQKDA